MNELTSIIIWTGALFSLVGVFATGMVLVGLFRGRDQEYRKQREEFLAQKSRVEDKIKQSRLRESR